MVFGLGILRLSPRDFWAMTPREIEAAVEGVHGRRAAVPARADLAALMAMFPDTKEEASR
jgi:uncharacterized phage protein (TIGR02216 family)